MVHKYEMERNMIQILPSFILKPLFEKYFYQLSLEFFFFGNCD